MFVNQEDSIIINKAAVERGLFRSTAYRTLVVEESKRNIKTIECIKLPPIDIQKPYYNYSKLDSDGIVMQGVYVDEKDVIVGKVVTSVSKTGNEESDASVTIKSDENGYVDKVVVTTTLDGYKLVKVKLRSVRIPEIGDKAACVVPKTTEVLTKRGWVYMEDVTLEDSVATLRDGQYIEYNNPTVLHHYEVSKTNLYELKSQQVELTTTMNHKMYIQRRDHPEFELKEAKEVVGKRVRYKKNGENMNPDVEMYHEFKMDDWLEFLGYWIADGCLIEKKRSKKTILSCQKERKVKKYGDVLVRLGLNVKRYNKDFVVHNLTLWGYLLDLNVGAGNKYLPEYAWSLSERQSRILLNAMIFGDGNAGANQACVMYYTSSTRLADDVMRLALHCGWAGNKIFRKPAGTEWHINGRSGVTNFDSWYVTVVKSKLTPQVNHGHTSTQNGQSERIIEYSGSVHCIEVPNHVFYVRQNGKGVWTGNSTAAQKSTISILLPPEDMPFSSKTGMVPDLILNPAAIPSQFGSRV
jgi:hypothetical protein